MILFGVPPGPLVLALSVATVVTALELVTSKYPRTSRFCLKSIWFYLYVVIYGLLAAGALALLPLIGSEVKIEGIGLTNPWVQAAFVGLSVKAFLHIRLFSVSTGPDQSFPFGLESFVQLFEPWMLRTIELDHYAEQSAFVEPLAGRYPAVDAARTKAKNNPPPALSKSESDAFESDIDHAPTSAEIIKVYLKLAGIRLTQRVFS